MGYLKGIGSADFAITLIIAIVIIKDAAGIRRKLGQQSKVLNKLIKDNGAIVLFAINPCDNFLIILLFDLFVVSGYIRDAKHFFNI